MEPSMNLALEIAMGICLAACAGLRAFLPLFVVGVAGRMDWIPLSQNFGWLSSAPALVILGVAVATELIGDKIPIVDHFLDLLQTFVRPAAGAVLAASVLTDLKPLQAALLGLLVGGSTAGLVHLTKAKLRILSTAATFGLGNPVLSVGEDVATIFGSVAALVIPFVMIALIVLGMILIILAMRRFSVRASHFQQ